MNVNISPMPPEKDNGAGRAKKKLARRDPVSLRLELTLVALKKRAADVSRDTGIGPNALSQYLSGKRRITVNSALKLRAAYGVSLDWIYAGDKSRLPYELGAAITVLQS